MKLEVDLEKFPKLVDNVGLNNVKKCILRVKKNMVSDPNNSYEVIFVIENLKSISWEKKIEYNLYELSIQFTGKLISFVKIKDHYTFDCTEIDKEEDRYIINFDNNQPKIITYMDYSDKNLNYVYKLISDRVNSIYTKINFFKF